MPVNQPEQSYPIGTMVVAAPAAGAVVLQYTFDVNTVFPPGWRGCQAFGATLATSRAVFNIYRAARGSTDFRLVGELTFLPGCPNGTFSDGPERHFGAGSTMRILAPSPYADSTLAGVSITMHGIRV